MTPGSAVDPALDATHAPGRRSWVESADGHPDFPIQNLPFGIFHRRDGTPADVEPSAGVAIGEMVLDLRAWRRLGTVPSDAARALEACDAPSLNRFMALGREQWSVLRRAIGDFLDADGAGRMENEALAPRVLVPVSATRPGLPAITGDYSDFYASVHHATNVGSMFRPDNPLLPNYKWIPIGYHGRASSLVPNGSRVRRPQGQLKPPDAEAPGFGPSQSLDYEMEIGLFVGPGNARGEALPIAEAGAHIFGICLVNDWSARDIQSWEYQPLGPFLAKSFATTVSPWVVTADALMPFRVPRPVRPAGDPAPLPYLDGDEDRARGGIALTVEVALTSAHMREAGVAPFRLSRASFADLYWTPAQLLTHHASNGCLLRPGDLLASGTVSGAEPGSRGCLLELTWRGRDPIRLPTGEERRFLQDGDEVIMRGYCERDGAVRIGLGECRGIVTPAQA